MWKVIAFGLLTMLGACSGDPRSFGITGPGAPPPPVVAPAQSPDDSPMPGVSTSGSYFGPNNGPTTGGSGFWGYN